MLGNTGFRRLHPGFLLSEPDVSMATCSRAEPQLACRMGKHISLASCCAAALGRLERSGLNRPTWQQPFRPLGMRRRQRGRGERTPWEPIASPTWGAQECLGTGSFNRHQPFASSKPHVTLNSNFLKNQ